MTTLTKVMVIHKTTPAMDGLTELMEEANDFMEDKYVIDVHFNTELVPGIGTRKMFTIWYREGE